MVYKPPILSKIPGKIGYGTVSEALAYKIPFVFVRRDYFNEEPFLRNMLEVSFGYGVDMEHFVSLLSTCLVPFSEINYSFARFIEILSFLSVLSSWC